MRNPRSSTQTARERLLTAGRCPWLVACLSPLDVTLRDVQYMRPRKILRPADSVTAVSKAFRRIADALADAGERGREDTGRHHASSAADDA